MKKIVKRIFDIFVSLVSLIILSPVFAVIALIIKINDKGPVIFKHERAGKDAKPFAFYKFRTMKLNVDPYDQSPSSGDDPRLIKCGKFLREYSLDELPQLFNVLKGDMSIVGPRPLYMSQIREFSEYHKKRFLLKPGITGFSQIYLRSELTSKQSLDLEVKYIEKQSFWLDMKIIFLTIGVVFGKRGVYQRSKQ
ncbi:MAG: sugar transferase [Candidatus Aminicenantes bacterium]|nr:MAG: sugar transferase [Candidatus Aminicenantes bacterium]